MSGSRCMEPASPSAYVSAFLSLSLSLCVTIIKKKLMSSSQRLSLDTVFKAALGIPGWHSGLAPAFGPGRDPGNQIPRWAPGAWSLFLPLPMSLPLSLSLCV